MKLLRLMFLLLLTLPWPATAALRVFACEPEWAALVQELGGNAVSIYMATTAQQDPHRIEARPSLIAQLRRADLAVCTGAELEIGWMPVLLRQAGNAKTQPGQPGYFEAAAAVARLEIPARVDRSMGDIHIAGNPHVHLDPHRVAVIAEALAQRLADVDPPSGAQYRTRYEAFARRWRDATERWTARAAPLRRVRVVSHHKNWAYLYDWLGMDEVGTLEPKPGIPPTTAHLAALQAELERAPARMVVRTPFEDPRPSRWLTERTGVREVMLPYTVGGSARATDLYALFDDTLERLLAAAR